MIARISRPPFTIRRSLPVLGAAVVGLAFPAGAVAATEQITTKAVTKTDGFRLQLKVVQGAPTGYGGRYPNSVAAILNKTNGHATQANNYAFSTPTPGGTHKLTFTGSKDLSSAKITGTFVNGGGSINMRFHATGKAYGVKLPSGCQGHGGQRRLGTLSGSYTLHAGKLGTITQKSFQATLSTAAFTCSKPTHGYDVQTIGFTPAWIDIFKSKTGSVSELIEKSGSGNGWAATHTYSVKGEPSSDYTVGTGLKSGKVKGDGGISGSATYSSPQSSSKQTTGALSGSLSATMATLGKVTALSSSAKRTAKQSHS